ncbi:Hint domain-containing protein [Seohaeicola saemankumensis]|nr:Hint domain-containing protein [Seohaeicola saemankumensis]MCA0871684.1 Hint domain-containing protein [Seohaeicola saemankumensis]
MSTLTFYADDTEFAGATGSNVNVAPGRSVFDNPPSAFLDLTITSNPGDEDPRLFEVGDTYDLNWGGFGGGGSIEDAVVVRSDMAPGDGGIIVFEGTNQSGELTQIIWTPDFNLEGWYWDHYNPSADPQFHTVDQNSSYDHMFMCFAAGTRISTAMGPVAVDDLWVGDRIDTLDAGAQPIRWIGRRHVPGHGANAPVQFAPGTIGNFAPLRLSQQHRVLIHSPMAELMFGHCDVLVPAKSLVNGVDICLSPCPRVEWVHLLLQDHHIVRAEGAPCETLLYGDMTQKIMRQVPDLPGIGTRAARPVLSYVEALTLLNRPAVRPLVAPRLTIPDPLAVI